jgi:hypothetical protein
MLTRVASENLEQLRFKLSGDGDVLQKHRSVTM